MTTMIIVALQALLALSPAGQAEDKQPHGQDDQKGIVRFFEDGGTLTCRLTTLRLPGSDKDDQPIVVFGPAGLSPTNPNKLVLDGVTFGKPVSIAELEGSDPASPHAKAGAAAGELCKPNAPGWNEFLGAFAACVDRKGCAALRGIAKPVEPWGATISASRHLTSQEILSMKR